MASVSPYPLAVARPATRAPIEIELIIPHRELSRDALNAIIEEFVTRDGTESSDAPDKSAKVQRALDAGELVLVYDHEADSCNILTPDAAHAVVVTTDPLENDS